MKFQHPTLANAGTFAVAVLAVIGLSVPLTGNPAPPRRHMGLVVLEPCH